MSAIHVVRMLYVISLLLALPVMAAVTELRCVGTEFTTLTRNTPDGPRGFALDILDELGKRAGFHCNVDLLPWKRAQALVARNEADLLIGPYRTRLREHDMVYLSRPFYFDDALFYGLDKVPFRWDGQIASLPRQQVAVVRGWTLGERFEAFRNQLNLVEVDSSDQALRLLLTGRITLVAGNERDFAPRIARPEFSAIKPVQPRIQNSAGYFALSGKWRGSALLARMDEAMQQMVNSGYILERSHAAGLSFPDTRFDWASYVAHELDNAPARSK
ncbi:substrate-binding periplasmic protein [Silvimonas iriomotensis]|uniref:ABC transporter substrate-binding protein n=1 Tax=Silvimonas iriomotensis TaxID=449662 RepID=A0ABQ2P8Z4_9NEIS|nr:transporter substrate-binding domain-containing protein [Silvimonas iriomotensis]GGP21034.1 ABC transporter substrate-binding protein [Silvimonas iriomotensis]